MLQKLLAALAVTAITVAPLAARAQTAISPTTPAEIQPGHPPPPPSSTGTAATPQLAIPTPLPPGAGADTPGGAARNGVIAPPASTADTAINRGAPGGNLATPVIPPPGSPGGNSTVVPK